MAVYEIKVTINRDGKNHVAPINSSCDERVITECISVVMVLFMEKASDLIHPKFNRIL